MLLALLLREGEPLPVALVPQYDPTELAGGPTDLDVLTFNSWWYDGGGLYRGAALTVRGAAPMSGSSFSL